MKFVDEIIDQGGKYLLYNTVDIFCVPSKDESCSLVVLEACMLGKSVIISGRVGVKYMLDDANCGLIFASEDTTDLSRAIKWCIGNRMQLSIMGLEARRAYEEKGTLEVFEGHFLEITSSIKTE